MVRTKSGISAIHTVGTFMNGRACSDTLFHVLSRAFDDPLEREEKATSLFAGGILQYGYQCGMLWGATLAAGARTHRRLGSGPRAEVEAVAEAQRLVELFRARKNCINCFEITHTDRSSSTLEMILYFLVKGGTIGCFRMAAGYASKAFNELTDGVGELPDKTLAPPVSCAAVVARKMGASELHQGMVAGLAGGIGLCGGGCGALGAALWIVAMDSAKEGIKGNLWNSKLFKSRADELIDRFLKCSGHEFECSQIVGRQFESIADHAAYLHDGGCSKVIETLSVR